MATHASSVTAPPGRPDPSTTVAVDPGPAILPDTDLLAGVMAGSQDAFAQLYDRYVDVVYRATLRLNSDRSAAGEVVQETFLTLWNRAEQFDPARGSLSSWLATIARNRAIDHLRRAARQPAMTFSAFGRPDAEDGAADDWLERSGTMIGAAGPEPTPEQALDEMELGASMARALASIDPDERRVIELAYHAGMSQSEIATHLDWPLGTVKTRTRRALRRLRESLEAAAGSGSVGPDGAPAHARAGVVRQADRSATAPRAASRSGPSVCGGV